MFCLPFAKFNLVRVEQRSNKIFRLKLSVWTIAREAAVYGEVFLEKALKCENNPRRLKKNL